MALRRPTPEQIPTGPAAPLRALYWRDALSARLAEAAGFTAYLVAPNGRAPERAVLVAPDTPAPWATGADGAACGGLPTAAVAYRPITVHHGQVIGWWHEAGATLPDYTIDRRALRAVVRLARARGIHVALRRRAAAAVAAAAVAAAADVEAPVCAHVFDALAGPTRAAHLAADAWALAAQAEEALVALAYALAAALSPARPSAVAGDA